MTRNGTSGYYVEDSTLKSEPLTHQERISGCILGTALGDALGLKREGLSRQRAVRLYGGPPLNMNLAFGRGYCSDDTEHSVMIARALISSGGETGAFEKHLARDLKRWLLCVPAGIGLATLRSISKLWLGFSPQSSGVFSAGNGPAMRAAILGLYAQSQHELDDLVTSSTRLTHTDPKALQGALAIARSCYWISQNNEPEIDIIRRVMESVSGEELLSHLDRVINGLDKQLTPAEFTDSMGWGNGVSGYINATVPAALYCWAAGKGDFETSVQNAVLLGGDSDTVAAITGALAGAQVGSSQLPNHWMNSLGEWPRDIEWMKQLALDLESSIVKSKHSAVASRKAMSMRWPQTFARNILFATVVVSLACRRAFPPY